MDAKLKAKELVEKFLDIIPHWSGDPSQADEINKSYAKQCALIAVDEIMVLVKGICEAFDALPDDYWSNVKEEIATL